MFTTRGRYALRIMIDLAEQNSDEYIPLKDIADRQEISKKYLEIIAKDMVKGGLIAGVSGKKGGYKLMRKASEYTVGEIIELMDGTMAPVACLESDCYNCTRTEICKTLPMWKEFYKLEREFFYGKKLSDLL